MSNESNANTPTTAPAKAPLLTPPFELGRLPLFATQVFFGQTAHVLIDRVMLDCET